MYDDYSYNHRPGTRYKECRCCLRDIVASFIDNDGLCPDCEGKNICGDCGKWVDAELDDDGICPNCIESEPMKKGA